MVGGSQSKLPHSMWSFLGVDPKEEVVSSANADRYFILWQARQSRVNDIHMSDVHRTP